MTRAFYETELFPGHQQALTTGLVNTKNGKPKAECGSGKGSCYGLGVYTEYDKSYGALWDYVGGTLGYMTTYLYFQDSGVIIVISQNSDRFNGTSCFKPMYQVIMKYIKATNK